MNSVEVRLPAHAGTFYPADPNELVKLIEWSFNHVLGPGKLPLKTEDREQRKTLGVIVPHAGYIYSGPVAAHAYYKLSKEEPPNTIILIGPNHTGIGIGVATYKGKAWKTPLGEIEIDLELAKLLTEKSYYLGFDNDAHAYEHSLEVQLPFLQYIYGDSFKIVPITAYMQDLDIAKDLGEAIHKVKEETGTDLIIVASTDFNHYESHEITVNKDMLAIQAILDRDEKRLYRVLEEHNITMCGPVGVATLIILSKLLNTDKPILLKHATSGDVTGEKDWVVGYASILFPV